MKIFIVEDDQWFGELIYHHLMKNDDFEVELIKNGKDLISKLKEKPDFISLDYNLPDIKGDKLLEKILDFDPNLNVLIVSEQKNISVATNLIKLGAFDYLVKDADVTKNIWNSVLKASKIISLQNEVNQLKEKLSTKKNKSKIVGNSEKLEKILKLAQKASTTNISVSILGETGTGKELVANEIANLSNKGILSVNISSLNENLIESELFGHEAGAFTGANKKHIGYFERANNGILFLDEIAELPLNIQAKLLRVLQEKEFRRVGGSKLIKSDFKLITATHKDLKVLVKNGEFREDLFYRIKGLSIELPPLRERGSDIIILAEYFINVFCEMNKLTPKNLSSTAKKKLASYSYPGNIRELKSIIELAYVVSGNEITESDLELESNLEMRLFVEEKTLKEYEEMIVNEYLKKYNNNVLKVAERLSIGKSTIYRMIKSNSKV